MGTILRLPTYTYYDGGSINKQSSISFILDDVLLEKIKTQYAAHGSAAWFYWSGADINDIPNKVNSALGFPLLSKKTCQPVLPIIYAAAWPNDFAPWVSDVLNKFYISYNLHTGLTSDIPTRLYSPSTNKDLNIYTGGQSANNGYVSTRTSDGVTRFYLGAYNYNICYNYDGSFLNRVNYQFIYQIYPEDFVLGREFNATYFSSGEHGYDTAYCIQIDVETEIDGSHSKVTKITVKPNTNGNMYMHADIVKPMESIGSDAQELDTDNPYGEGGSATIGGGDGAFGDIDAIDGADIPGLPTISAADLGFITMYNPTAAQLKSLSDYMWSNQFDLVTYKKLFSDPMQSIIGLAIVPVAPSIAGSKNVMFGTLDSGISMSYLSTNYVQKDCGSVSIDKYVGCFMDNDPYTKISIYLPFIGIRQLSADDVIGGSINVVYNIDVLTGACACFIKHSSRGVLYSYNGSCITNVPLTAVNFSGAIQNAVTAIGSMVGMAAGMATGAAPITAMSIAGMMTSAANTAMNSKPQVQRSGNLGGSAGIMSILTPYVIIERPSLSVPNKVEKFVGQTSNITMRLSDCSGFTMCDYVHLDGLNATSEEILEIESMLKAGVIL